MRRALAASVIVIAGCSHRVQDASSTRPGAPAVATTMQRQVLNAIDAGDGDVRVRQLRLKMAAEPRNQAVRIELAKRYEAIGCPELAMEHYRLACIEFPDSEELHLLLAQSLRMTPAPEQAVKVLEEFAGRHTDATAEVHAWLGILRDELGRFQDAEHAHRAAITLSPEKSGLHNNLGYNLLLQGRHAEAAQEFRRALAIEPRSEIARNNLGLALAVNPKEAVLHWQSVSGPAAAHSNLAALLIEQGRYEEARNEIAIALSHQRDHGAALANLRLLAELDGGPAQVSLADQRASSWARFWAGFKGVFVTTKTEESHRDVLTGRRTGDHR